MNRSKESVSFAEVLKQVGQTYLFSISSQDALFEHSSSKDLKHSTTFLHTFLFGKEFFIVFVGNIFLFFAVPVCRSESAFNRLKNESREK